MMHTSNNTCQSPLRQNIVAGTQAEDRAENMCSADFFFVVVFFVRFFLFVFFVFFCSFLLRSGFFFF